MNEASQILFARYLSGELSDEEAEALLASCRADAELSAEFVRQVRFERELNWLLRTEAEGDAVFQEEVLQRMRADSTEGASFIASVVGRVAHSYPRVVAFAPARRQWPATVGWLGLAACLAILITLGMQWWAHKETGSLAVNLAALTRASGARWEGSPHVVGEALPSGWLKLKAGAVEVEFMRGARVVLEGPADFQIVSENEGFLRYGKMRVQAPTAAHGFKVRGPGFSATDLGTEFGCEVPETGTVEVHVFAGEVRFEPGIAASHLLAAREAVRYDGTKTEEMPARPDLFLSESQLAERVRAEAGDRLAAWRVSNRALDTNPATIFHFDFEQLQTGIRALPLWAAGGVASIVGCDYVEGRWPGKGALGFARPDDRLRLSVPGEFHALTLMAWIRADDLPNKGSLLMSDLAQPGEVHWYFYSDGSLIFGVNTLPDEERGWRMIRSQPVLRRELFGAWVFVAVSFDEATGAVALYFNGEPIQSMSLPVHVPLRFGTCEIGNWGVRAGEPKWAGLKPRNADDFVRNFHGRIDEFTALSSALPAADIRQFYEAGKPAL